MGQPKKGKEDLPTEEAATVMGHHFTHRDINQLTIVRIMGIRFLTVRKIEWTLNFIEWGLSV